MTPPLRIWLLLFALGAIWGASFFLAKIALAAFGPLTVAAARVAIGALILLAVAAAQGARSFGSLATGAAWRFAAAAAVISSALPFILLNWAQLHTPSSVAGVYMAVLPLFVLPLSHVFIPGDRMTTRKTIGFLIGFCGVIILIGPAAAHIFDPVSGGGAAGALAVWAQLACVGATVCYALGSVIMKRAPESDPIGFGAATLALSSVILIPLAALFDAAPPPPPMESTVKSVAALIALGVGPTALAMVMLLQVLRAAGPSFLSLVNYQVPVWAVAYGALLLSEPLNPRLGGALALILLGVAVAQGAAHGLWAWRRRRRAPWRAP